MDVCITLLKTKHLKSVIKNTTETGLNATSKPLLVEDVARFFGISAYTIREWIKSGKLKATKIGKRYFVKPETLKEMMGR